MNDLYYMTHTACDGTNARGVLATSKDLRRLRKREGIIPLLWAMDLILLQ